MTIVLHASTDRQEMWGGPKRYIRIVIHKTNDEFRKAAEKYSPHMDWDGTAGAFHPSTRRENWNKVTATFDDTSDKHYAGTMRLSEEQMTQETIVHECVHAGAHIYRIDLAQRIELGDDCGDNEENLAYIIGDVASSVTIALYKKGFFDNDE